ncbi:MAG TPA: RNA 3'-terminal phosphate cyclase [Fimbriimonadaceae bacterium]|nr:RNA 3'-terminal phosphate cyclase [Fimbriimonadaceae bacterium]
MPGPGSPILIDGSHGEGGGALVRTCLVMSTLTLQPVRIDGVRGGTKFPGLDFEDLLLLKALAKSCSAETTGVQIGSTTVSFLPTRRPKGLNENLDLPEESSHHRSASVPVVLCSLLPVLAKTGAYSEVSLSGETYGTRSLSFDYFLNVTIPALQKMGLYAFPDQELAGFGRESRGQVTMDVEPSAIQGIDWPSRGNLVGAKAVVTTAELPVSVAHRAINHLEKLAQNAKLPIEIETNPVDSRTPGAFVTIWAQYERGVGGATAIGQRGLRVEHLVQAAFQETLAWIATDATVDPFLADQLLIPACLAEGETIFKTSRLTKRFLTATWVVKQFLPIHITVRGSEDQPGVVTVAK